MGRKHTAPFELDDAGEPLEVEAPPSARRSRARAERRPDWRGRFRIAGLSAALALALSGAIVLCYRVDQFLASGSQFTLAEAAEAGAHSGIRIEGAAYTRRDELQRVFGADLGRSIYLIPLEQRRRALMAIDWVREASVSRLWPNRVLVRITERRPAAFVMLPLPGEDASGMALIDEEGVILRPPARARFQLPVLVGVRAEQPPGERRQRVAVLQRFLREAGGLSNQTSEIDATLPENLIITQNVENRAVRLLMGNRNFGTRLRNFLGHYPEIRPRLPNDSLMFDLRLDDRITALQDGQQQGGEKNVR